MGRGESSLSPALLHFYMMFCGFYCCYFLREIQSADFAVVEMFEEAEGRNPGQTSIDDLPKVLKLRKDVLEKHVMCYFVTSSYLYKLNLIDATFFPCSH